MKVQVRVGRVRRENKTKGKGRGSTQGGLVRKRK